MLTHQQLEIEIRTSINYHLKMEEVLNKIKVLTPIITLTIIACILWPLNDINKILKNFAVIIPTLTVFLELTKIILDLNKRSIEHYNLRKRYLDILIKLYKKNPQKYCTIDLNELKIEQLQIKKEESPLNNVLNIISYNKVIISMFSNKNEIKKYFIHVPWYKMQTYHIIDWNITKRNIHSTKY